MILKMDKNSFDISWAREERIDFNYDRPTNETP